MTKHWMQRPLVRYFSLLLAAALSVIILVYPHALILPNGHTHHGWLMVLLAGISIGFIHGVGFRTKTTIGRWLLGPVLAWGIMLPGIIYLLLN